MKKTSLTNDVFSNNFTVMNYSILLPVYHKDKKEYLKISIESMLNQTVKSDDFVIVKDGPLTEELDSLINEYASNKDNHINVVALDTNSGLGAALDFGLRQCKNELIARMDADDISLPTRCERLLELFAKNDKLSIAGTYIDEFDEDPNNIISVRTVPVDDAAIKKYNRRRQAFNHPTIMFKKSEVLRVGSYPNFRHMEDKDLFFRMLANGCIGENIPESLLLFRSNKDSFKRRRGKAYRKATIMVAKLNYKRKYIRYSDYLYMFWGQQLMRFMPNWLLIKLLRKKKKKVK